MRDAPVNVDDMDPDDLSPKRKDDLVAQLGGQDLDPYSVEELEARIIALEAEILRARARLSAAVNHRASADALFRRS
jgi:uncharacterized small protein (DUF1192 family)